MDWLISLDYTVFTWINGMVGKSSLLDSAMQAFCNDHLVPFTLGFIAVVMALHGRNRAGDRDNLAAVVRIFVTIAVASALLQVAVTLVHRERPFFDHEVNLLFYKPTDSSFPSNPAMAAFAFFFSALFSGRRFAWWFFPPAALMSFSRIYCGVHYPGDVLAGILLAAASAYLVHRLSFLSRPLIAIVNTLESRLRSSLSVRE